ncbi:LCP family protein [Streptomyces sp. NBC_01262]|uniref:LCP family protein n=1 Tax=Streptomyces sp. NBC_01262 TaxID=2903803 RepID=UPI002E33EAA9|nr:LCP family protein [Streptomyces sp. NBC_01262]
MNDAHPRWQYADGQEPYPQDPQQQDPYGQQQPDYSNGQQGYGYDPYEQQQQGYPQQPPYYPEPEPQQYQGYIPQQPQYGDYPQPQQPPQQYQQPQYEQPQPQYEEPAPAPAAPQDRDYRTEQFAFVDEDAEESEEVIDWLKFTESRVERRDERKRRGRKRVVALVVVLAMVAVGGVGYLWKTGRIPGLGDTATATTTATGAQKRDVIVLHLRPVDSDETSTALLVSNSTTDRGTTVLLPNSLAISTDDGDTTTLGKSVVDEGATPTREGLDNLLGTKIAGTWRLDTPYLELLVDSLGDILVDTDATVKSKDTTLVKPGKQQELNGKAAVAYATYRASGEAQDKQLARFGQVVQALLKKFPSSASLGVKTIQTLNAIPDPSLKEKELGASLSALAEQAKTGAYATESLPVQTDGTLSAKATQSVVKDVLGGTITNSSTDGVLRISVRNASGDKANTTQAQAAVVNAGYTYVAAGTGTAQAASQVIYTDAARKADAQEVAKTLGLAAGVVKKGTGASNADITVVLGKDYKG